MTWALATIAALLMGYATVSRRLKRLNVSGAMFFTTAGLLVGPVLGLLELQVHGEQVKLLAEISADAGAVRRRVADLVACAAPRVRGAAAAAGNRPAAHDHRR